MTTGFIIAASVFFGVALLLGFIRLIFSSVRKKLETYIQVNFDKKDVLGVTTRANFFGEQSKGARQIRGNGALVLTKDQVHFIRALPFKEIAIPLKSVSGVSLPDSFNGKTVFSRLLCIHFQTPAGADAFGIAVKDPETWKEAIENLIRSGKDSGQVF